MTTKRFFLEDAGRRVYTQQMMGGIPDPVDTYLIPRGALKDHFNGLELPPLLAVDSYLGRLFLKRRELSGPAKMQLIQSVGQILIKSLLEITSEVKRGSIKDPALVELLGEVDSPEEEEHRVAQILVLWGGAPLDIGYASPPVADDLLTAQIKLTRVLKEDGKGFLIKPGHSVNWPLPVDGENPVTTWLVFEECIASGSTVIYLLEDAFRQLKPEERPKQIILTPVCASAFGLAGIYKVCKAYKVKIIVAANEGALEVLPQGVILPDTDLCLGSKGVVTRQTFEEIAKRWQGNIKICLVGDIGDSQRQVASHLAETLYHMVALEISLQKEDWTRWPRLIFKPSFRKDFDHFCSDWKKHKLDPEITEKLRGQCLKGDKFIWEQ